jgi:hypothetical protein
MLESLGKADKTLASKSDEVMFSSGFYEMIGETSRTIFVGVFLSPNSRASQLSTESSS